MRGASTPRSSGPPSHPELAGPIMPRHVTPPGASMRTIAHLSLASALLAACSAPKDAKPAADTVAATPTVSTAPQAVVTAIYLWPKDTAAFEKYYPTHLKIVGDRQQEIGFTRAELTRFSSDLQGG